MRFSVIAAAVLVLHLATMVEAEDGAQTVEQEFEVDTETRDKLSAEEAAEQMRGAEEAAKDQPKGSSLVDEWDTHMEGFLPDLLLTFPLPSRTDEYFYEDVTTEPVLLRGGFFASAEEETSSVDFQITDPTGDIIFSKNDQSEGLFHFIARKRGTYTFIVSNHKWMQSKMVTFAVGMGNDTTLQTEHLNTMDQHVKGIERTLKDIQTESTYLWIRQKSHMKAVESIHQRVFWFCFVEFLILIGVSGFQVYYIKGLLSDRRIL